MPPPAHSSRESDLGHPAEVVTNWRKHNMFLTSEKTEIATSA